MLFVDFKQAYDSINREQLWIILKNIEIPRKVRLGTVYLRQGETVLFNLALEKVVRDISDLKEMEIIGPYTLLVYADDTIILGESRNDIEESAKKIMKSSCNVELVINENKTKYMVITRCANVKDNLCSEGLTSEQVEDLNYLGVIRRLEWTGHV